MLDHINLPVSDFARSLDFYRSVLAPLGITLLNEVPASVTGTVAYAGFGRAAPQLWLFEAPVQAGLHIALTAPDDAAVQGFHAAGLAAGARDNGAPGLRPHYHSGYYAAFLYDPDGHNIEAVHHQPEPASALRPDP